MKKKIIIILGMIFILLMLALFGYYLMKGDTSRWSVALGGAGVSALPLFLLIKENPFSIPIIIGYYVFLFCTAILGSIASFYLKIHWWDTMLHFYKGIFVGFIAITLYKIFIKEEIRKGISKWMLFLFTLSLVEMVSVLWEIYEFIGDQTFTHMMQLGGNKDTMIDLIFGSLGGFLVALFSIIRWHKI